MIPSDLLLDAFGRIRQIVHRTLDGLDESMLKVRPGPEANPIGWLVWHLTRVQDSHMAELADKPQIWQTGGWAERFDLAADYADTGYGHTSAQVEELSNASIEALLGYHDAVHEQTTTWVSQVAADELDRIVDERWDPPVSAGVRIVSVIGDGLQHAGQAAYVRGLLESRPQSA